MVSQGHTDFDIHGALEALLGAEPFPWQKRLLDRFLEGQLPKALDLPTGLGKTKVIPIWLVARAAGAAVPQRLVYVVDRRAIVDQATREAERLPIVLIGSGEEAATGASPARIDRNAKSPRQQFRTALRSFYSDRKGAEA